MANSELTNELPDGSAAYLETLYARFVEDPASVDQSWRSYFEKLEAGAGQSISNGNLRPSWSRKHWPLLPDDDMTTALAPGLPVPAVIEEGKVPEDAIRAATVDSIRALMLIRAYRVRGHLVARLDPLGLLERPPHSELEPESYGFTKDDFDRQIFIDDVLGLETASIREILEIVRRTYCAHVGVEFMHINEPDEKAWIQEHIEGRDKEIQFTDKGKLAILERLIEAEQFEKFLGRKYLGTKRFGLDGSEAMVPALEGVIKTGGHLGVEEIVIGMAHRGRLNVLANVMHKPMRAIFHEFHGGSAKPDEIQGSGDVKYHLGTSSDREFDGNPVHLSLTANPSHLEAVNPVVLGKARAKQTQRKNRTGSAVLSLLLHGDAAFAGEGIVAETFMLSGLKGYRTGGTVHFIINNQIGFTTSPKFARSSPYPSDVAKMVQAPIFHVNGDDPEAVVYVTKLATEFRQKFKKDVVIDMFCYRRFGHNESDEPAFTQPLMYSTIRAHKSVAVLYGERLREEGLVSADDIEAMVGAAKEKLQKEFDVADDYSPEKADWFEGRWAGLGLAGKGARRAKSGISRKRLMEIGRALTTIPEGFNLHKTLQRVLEHKAQMFETGKGFDWATGEAIAIGSLLQDGIPVRLSGQDSIRGTFSQRHAELVDQKTEARYRPLQALSEEVEFEILDSPLSEAGVLGFEYGYSLAEPRSLVIWEAQFGDFANMAQVVIDQFIASGEAKWLRMTGIVLLLPHGYEGQGPEHSSARLERFLQLCAEDNMQVANCTTPANYCHILRRQMLRKFRKPLVIMTPKSLLRHKRAVSRIEEFETGGQFHRLLWDDSQLNPDAGLALKSDDGIDRVILCSGKVYYDLQEKRDERGDDGTYILRVEQLYPFPERPLAEELGRFKNAERVIWCQEEPDNMGAWFFVEHRIEKVMKKLKLKAKGPIYAGRPESAATATGLLTTHEKEQDALLDAALSK